jgi:hypothetical protein
MLDRLEQAADDYSPITSADDPWHELREGEYALAIGGLRSIIENRVDAHGIVPNFTIGFSDWTEIVVDVPAGIPQELRDLREGFRMIYFKLIRTEDGFEGVAAWEKGCMPIPLIQQRTTVS